MHVMRQVWSVSYGFPEAWTCYIQDELCEEGVGAPHGYDPSVYLKRANTQLAKLAALGVSRSKHVCKKSRAKLTTNYDVWGECSASTARAVSKVLCAIYSRMYEIFGKSGKWHLCHRRGGFNFCLRAIYI